jgi:hypothetical protein
VLLTDANTALGSVAIAVSGLGNDITLQNEADGFTVGTVAGITGISTAGGAGTTGSITLGTTSGNLALANNVSSRQLQHIGRRECRLGLDQPHRGRCRWPPSPAAAATP